MDKRVKKTQRLYRCECQNCGKIFSRRFPKQKYCSKKCRIEAAKERLEEITQPCVHCQRATGKPIDFIVCPWAKALIPVTGWDATPHIVKECGIEKLYHTIHSCPLFLQDPPRKGRS